MERKNEWERKPSVELFNEESLPVLFCLSLLFSDTSAEPKWSTGFLLLASLKRELVPESYELTQKDRM